MIAASSPFPPPIMGDKSSSEDHRHIYPCAGFRQFMCRREKNYRRLLPGGHIRRRFSRQSEKLVQSTTVPYHVGWGFSPQCNLGQLCSVWNYSPINAGVPPVQGSCRPRHLLVRGWIRCWTPPMGPPF